MFDKFLIKETYSRVQTIIADICNIYFSNEIDRRLSIDSDFKLPMYEREEIQLFVS